MSLAQNFTTSDIDRIVEDLEDEKDELSPREVKKLKLKQAAGQLYRLAKLLPHMSDEDKLAALKMFDDAEKTACELSLATFFRCAWSHMDTAEYQHNWHIDVIAEKAEQLVTGECRRLIVNQPPRTGKSNLLSVALPAWIWCQPERGPMSGPQVKFMFGSYGQALSFNHSVLCRNLILSNWYQKNWGHRFKLSEDRNAVGHFENDKGGARIATSVGAALTGLGADCVGEGTPISTPTGDVKVQHLKANDVVFGFDHSRGLVVKAKVKATRKLYKTGFYEIRTASGFSFKCTGDHPVFIPVQGYVAASELRPGDRVICKDRAQSARESYLRLLRYRKSENAIRFSKDIKTWTQRHLLRHEVLSRTSQNEKFEKLPGVWRSSTAHFRILLAHMRKSRDAKTRYYSAREVLRAMWYFILRTQQHLLLAGMLEQSAFDADVGNAKFQFQGIGKVFEPVQKDRTLHSNSRRFFLHRLRKERRQNEIQARHNREVAYALDTASTSYRRRYEKQPAGESIALMQCVPQEAPSWNLDTIVNIRCDSTSKNVFYDLEVENVSNFFAENVLVHNCIGLDDVHNTQDVTSEADREGAWNWYSQSVSTRLNNPKTGVMFLVMQRQHEDDLTGKLLTEEGDLWDHVVLRMRYETEPYLPYDQRTEEGELLWPTRVPEIEVSKLERTLGTYGASGQLQQRPQPKGGGILKAEYWGIYPPVGMEEEFKRDGIVCWPPFEFLVASLDGGYTEKESNDPSALTIWGLWFDRAGLPKIIAVHAWEDFLSINKLVMRVGNNCRKFKVDVLLIEAKASGISVSQEIQRLFGSADWSTVLCQVKGDKVARAVSVQGIFEDGTILAPDRVWAQLLIDRCASFPKGKRKDLVDSTTQALRWLRDNALIKRREEIIIEQNAALPRSGEIGTEGEALYDV